MSLDDFHDTLTGLILGFAKKLRPGAKIALLIQSTRPGFLETPWVAGRHEIWHGIDIAMNTKHAGFEHSNRFACCVRAPGPYTPEEIKWARDNRERLPLSRDLIIWQVPDK